MVVRLVLVLLPVPSTTPISFFFGVYAPAPSSLLSTTLLSYPGPPTSLLALLHRFFLPLSTMVASFASTRVSIFSGPIPTVLTTTTTTTRSVTTSTTHKNTLIKTLINTHYSLLTTHYSHILSFFTIYSLTEEGPSPQMEQIALFPFLMLAYAVLLLNIYNKILILTLQL